MGKQTGVASTVTSSIIHKSASIGNTHVDCFNQNEEINRKMLRFF
jgi:hypothetical protein